ncbi:MAG: OmpA family protein [Flavobacteriales bacterium]|nr:OmpA family protein [Flavobacteriales bacterium]
MKKIAILFVALMGGMAVQAQTAYDEMVENGSFEQIEGKLKRGGGINLAVGWMSPTKTAADLFSGKVKTEWGTPDNARGKEEPYDGKNYVGIRTFSYNGKEARNYISTKLKLPLRKGAKYCVKFYVSLAEGSKYAANNIGVDFSKKQWNIDEDRSIMTATDVQHKDNPVFNGQYVWDEICGVYTATGGEKFLTIGNFTADGSTTNERLKKPKDFMGAQVVSAYYYIDNISVKMIDSEDECECQSDALEQETSIIYEEAPINAEGMKPNLIAQFTTCYFGYGDSELTASDEGHLNNIQKMLTDNTGKVMITAHLDSDEATDPKLAGLAGQRAQAAKAYLIKKGIDASRIMVEEKADEMPKDQSGTELGQAKNRRVTFTYIP